MQPAYAAHTTTDSAGRYMLLGLPSGGTYTIRTRRVGYIASERSGILLTIDARRTADFALHSLVAQLSEVALRLKAALGRDGRIGGRTGVAREQFDALPIADRNYSSLAVLSPLAGKQLANSWQTAGDRRPAVDEYRLPDRQRAIAQLAARRNSQRWPGSYVTRSHQCRPYAVDQSY